MFGRINMIKQYTWHAPAVQIKQMLSFLLLSFTNFPRGCTRTWLSWLSGNGDLPSYVCLRAPQPEKKRLSRQPVFFVAVILSTSSFLLHWGNKLTDPLYIIQRYYTFCWNGSFPWTLETVCNRGLRRWASPEVWKPHMTLLSLSFSVWENLMLLFDTTSGPRHLFVSQNCISELRLWGRHI